jgi:carboxymethylenebutenolidase
VSVLAAARRAFGAAVGFYGGGIVTPRFPQFPALVDEAATLKTPWLGLFGDEDGSIPVEDVETLRTALVKAPVDTEIVRYGDAEHGFFCDERPAYHSSAADDAWSRTLDWFDRHLPGGPA